LLEVRPNCRVMQILSNDRGEVTGVEYLDEHGELHVQPAGVVVLSANVYENVRLLLLSTSDCYANGLANNSGRVGKNYLSQAYAGRSGLFLGNRLGLFPAPAGKPSSWTT
jgi:choline dehydrogenase-like flavoprotein